VLHQLRALVHAAGVSLAGKRDDRVDLNRGVSLERRYASPDLLLIDELGYVPSDSRAADLLFRIISLRHEARAVVITTNLAFAR
jgi:DNA replication protein DnaC